MRFLVIIREGDPVGVLLDEGDRSGIPRLFELRDESKRGGDKKGGSKGPRLPTIS